MSCNRGKESLALDLRKPAGRDILDRLIKRSQVVVHNFRPDFAEKYALTYDDVRALQPEVIYAAVTAFGEQGAYRLRPAVDSVVLVVDCVKGVEEQTEKLMNVCRMRKTPVIVFVNKLDREGKNTIELLDEIEKELAIEVRPLTWPIGQGRSFKGVYDIAASAIHLFRPGQTRAPTDTIAIDGLDDPRLEAEVGESLAARLREEISLVGGIYAAGRLQEYSDWARGLQRTDVLRLLDKRVGEINPKVLTQMAEDDARRFAPTFEGLADEEIAQQTVGKLALIMGATPDDATRVLGKRAGDLQTQQIVHLAYWGRLSDEVAGAIRATETGALRGTLGADDTIRAGQEAASQAENVAVEDEKLRIKLPTDTLEGGERFPPRSLGLLLVEVKQLAVALPVVGHRGLPLARRHAI